MIKTISRETLAQTINRIDLEQFKVDYNTFSPVELQKRYQLSEIRFYEITKQLQLGKYRPRMTIEALCELIPKDVYLRYVQKEGVKGLRKQYNIDARQAKLLQDTYGIQLRKKPQTYEEFKSSINLEAFIEYISKGGTKYSNFLRTKNNRFINRLLDDLGIKKRKSIEDYTTNIDIEQFKADFARYSMQELAEKYCIGARVVKQLAKQFGLKHTVEETRSFILNTRLKANPGKTLDEILSTSAKMANKTKQEKGVSNTSSIETFVGNALKSNYGDHSVIAQYYTDEYPFCCDFYVQNKELFIEVNGHFTHGYRPFNKNLAEDLNTLVKVKQKQGYYISSGGQKKKNSYFAYERVWTKTDPKKIDCALKNKLKYIMIYMERNHAVKIYVSRAIANIKDIEELFKDIFKESDYKLLGVCYLEDYLNL